MKRLPLCIFIISFALSGCGGSEGAEQEEVVDPDGDSDEEERENGDGDEEDDPPICSDPPPTCDGGACGVITNACGEAIDCGACPCKDGEATITSCGTCEIGIWKCGDDETGPGICEVPSIPGMDDDGGCGQFVFVDSDRGSSVGAGTKEDPLANLAVALQLAGEVGAVAVLAAGGEGQTYYEGPMEVQEGVSVLGSFNGASWTYTPERLARVHTTAVDTAVDAIFGIRALEVGAPTLLSNLLVTTEDGAEAETHYGVYSHLTSNLELLRIDSRPGDGRAGTPGAAGSAGAEGSGGESLGNAYRASAPGTPYPINQPPLRERLKGGENSNCSGTSGGDGGGGQYLVMYSEDVVLSEPGQDMYGAIGGSRGVEPSSNIGSAGDGGQGDDGAAGAQGIGGDGGESAQRVDGGFWKPRAEGEAGGIGVNGRGGAGGGGAGRPLDTFAGAEGGGGGAGGCPGTGGEGGSGGASTIAIMAVQSELTLVDSSFVGGTGGVGGAGGAGGPGGPGGLGGRGSKKSCNRSSETDDVWCETLIGGPFGGWGGDGGSGGDGGAGGGGAGGSSLGGFCIASTISLRGTVSFSAGEPGEGGAGGNIGAEGKEVENQGCY